ncbi:Zinc finger, CCHC-type [Pseudocohnilembus persalinus]|uniref:Zinc finger, CCHC-type n=1 Tax=Pseudocohnilembus persalinus TaxID=266149 RepID=A0A0V0R7C6_PSEPJ|nr:Zinc finger, CCHC-type [Pseudocohnilembus persalinus]|eukprot:KRX10380.1 Zinc finger, CCHC-type [Pseudocohnilembus persalinus]
MIGQQEFEEYPQHIQDLYQKSQNNVYSLIMNGIKDDKQKQTSSRCEIDDIFAKITKNNSVLNNTTVKIEKDNQLEINNNTDNFNNIENNNKKKINTDIQNKEEIQIQSIEKENFEEKSQYQLKDQNENKQIIQPLNIQQFQGTYNNYKQNSNQNQIQSNSQQQQGNCVIKGQQQQQNDQKNSSQSSFFNIKIVNNLSQKEQQCNKGQLDEKENLKFLQIKTQQIAKEMEQMEDQQNNNKNQNINQQQNKKYNSINSIKVVKKNNDNQIQVVKKQQQYQQQLQQQQQFRHDKVVRINRDSGYFDCLNCLSNEHITYKCPFKRCYRCDSEKHIQRECKVRGDKCYNCHKVHKPCGMLVVNSEMNNIQLQENQNQFIKCLNCRKYGHFNCLNEGDHINKSFSSLQLVDLNKSKSKRYSKDLKKQNSYIKHDNNRKYMDFDNKYQGYQPNSTSCELDGVDDQDDSESQNDSFYEKQLLKNSFGNLSNNSGNGFSKSKKQNYFQNANFLIESDSDSGDFDTLLKNRTKNQKNNGRSKSNSQNNSRSRSRSRSKSKSKNRKKSKQMKCPTLK